MLDDTIVARGEPVKEQSPPPESQTIGKVNSRQCRKSIRWFSANTGLAFDHPEAVAWGPDGRAYAGGEAGQLYRFGLADGKSSKKSRAFEGGFLLGLAHDAEGNTYACDDRSACVHRITPEGKISSTQTAMPSRRCACPTIRSSTISGNLYVSDSGTWGGRDGLHLEDRAGRQGGDLGPPVPMVSPMACACRPMDAHSMSSSSSPPLISRIEIGPNGSAGKRTVVVELPRTVPDGVALDQNGDLYISLYNPNIIYRLSNGWRAYDTL